MNDELQALRIPVGAICLIGLLIVLTLEEIIDRLIVVVSSGGEVRTAR